MHPTSEPAHESVPQTSPGVAKRTYDERAAFEEAKRNLGIVGDKDSTGEWRFSVKRIPLR